MALRIISNQSEEEIKRQASLKQLTWEMRRLAANFLRLVSGSGRAPDLLGQMERVSNAIREYADAHDGKPPPSKDGKAVKIAKIYGSYLDFDQAGKVDESFDQAANEAMDIFETYERFERSKSSKVVSLIPKLRRQEYERERRWEPSKQDIELISEALFRTTRRGPRRRS
jgi:hypothetical protein